MCPLDFHWTSIASGVIEKHCISTQCLEYSDGVVGVDHQVPFVFRSCRSREEGSGAEPGL